MITATDILRHTLGEMVCAKDGSVSMTRVAGCFAHFSLFVWFWRENYLRGFVADQWIIYGGLTIAHAFADKTAAMVRDFKDKHVANTLKE
jgi:hypothetical protein